MLREYFTPTRISTFEDHGLNSDAIEAMAFALLAYEAFRGRANNIPAATGARRAVIMGKIIPSGSGPEGRSQ
jgi:anhydro-N-acetylmuramic acid kinase